MRCPNCLGEVKLRRSRCPWCGLGLRRHQAARLGFALGVVALLGGLLLGPLAG